MFNSLKMVKRDGVCQMDGTGKPYEEAATMGDCLNAILNLDSVMRQLWPHDCQVR